MTTFTTETSVYPVSVTVESANGVSELFNKCRTTLRDGYLGIWDTNVRKPYIFAQVLWAQVVDGRIMQHGLSFEAQTVDGDRVVISAPQGCGCGDPGKRHIWPQDYLDNRNIVLTLAESDV